MRLLRLLLLAVAALPGWAELRSGFDPETRRWTLSNSQIEAQFELDPAGRFHVLGLRQAGDGPEWTAAFTAVNSPVRLVVDGEAWDGETSCRLVSHAAARTARGGLRLTIVLARAAAGSGEVTLEFELYENLPVLRWGVRYRNVGSGVVEVSDASPVAWRFGDRGATYRTLRVEQWMPAVSNPADFERLVNVLPGDGRSIAVASGSHNRYCSWLALVNDRLEGLALGWEFDGRAEVRVTHRAGERALLLDSAIPDLHHPVAPGEDFQVPRGFVALFRGDWDDAAFATQRFVEQALAIQPPGGEAFPYVSWDSWAYGPELNEASLRRNAEIAARLGIELFVVDLGWARSIGDWREDRSKFPSGLRALSDYVHSLGMKFGLHYAFAEAAPESPLLADSRNADWTSSVDYGYYGARSLCLAHKPVRDWVIAETIRVIDEYGVDWILQDGENMVKECRKTTHTHHPEDSNYSNAVDGLSYVLGEVQRQRPGTAWENCENGGNMMTFQMVQHYATSIVNDASGARGSRQSVYGATYPLPPRYTDRYMPEWRLNSYVTRSYLFGGPWIFMNRLEEMAAEDLEFAAAEIAHYKRARGVIRDGKVLHLTAPPAEGRIDAIAAYDGERDAAVAVVTRDGGPAATWRFRLREAAEGATYRVTFATDRRTLTVSGAQLRDQGVLVRLDGEWSAEVVFVDRQYLPSRE